MVRSPVGIVAFSRSTGAQAVGASSPATIHRARRMLPAFMLCSGRRGEHVGVRRGERVEKREKSDRLLRSGKCVAAIEYEIGHAGNSALPRQLVGRSDALIFRIAREKL